MATDRPMLESGKVYRVKRPRKPENFALRDPYTLLAGIVLQERAAGA